MATVIRERRVVGGGVDAAIIVHRILNTILMIINVFLIIRLILKITGANPGTAFVNFIYSLTALLVSPFSGIFSNASDNVNSGVFEWSTLIAIIVYSLAVIVIERIIDAISTPRSTTYVE